MQEHMIKMYDNIAALEFNDGPNGEKIASAMISAEKEAIDKNNFQFKILTACLNISIGDLKVNRVLHFQSIFELAT